MFVRPTLAFAAIAALFAPTAPASAADYVGPPIFSTCGVPPAALAQADSKGFKGWATTALPARITDVERFNPHTPPAVAVPVYVPPQTAFLTSPLCDFPNGVSDRSWYDGRLFYKSGGVHAAPDTFMVIER